MRVSGASAAFVHDSLSDVNVPRRCCRPGCPHYAVATLTFVYSDSTAVVGPLATAREPHSWDLCVGHAGRITAPRGWELVRHAGPLNSEPTNPDEDDLVALADAVREGGAGEASLPHVGGTGMPLNGFPRERQMSPPTRICTTPEPRPPRPAAICSRRRKNGPVAAAGICGCCPIRPTRAPLGPIG